MLRTISFSLNGRPEHVAVEENRKVLWVLRTDLGLRGTKYGCGHGFCGACTVLVNGQPMRSCLLSMGMLDGREVQTIEGLADGDHLHPLQEAFIDHQAFQCGFCTPGMIMTACALLRENPHPTPSDIVQHLDRHLCRCGAHTRIIAAIQAAARGEGVDR